MALRITKTRENVLPSSHKILAIFSFPHLLVCPPTQSNPAINHVLYYKENKNNPVLSLDLENTFFHKKRGQISGQDGDLQP